MIPASMGGGRVDKTRDDLPAWEQADRNDYTRRLKVPGGWLYMTWEYQGIKRGAIAMAFVPEVYVNRQIPVQEPLKYPYYQELNHPIGTNGDVTGPWEHPLT